MNGKDLAIREDLISAEIQERMIPYKMGSFLYKDTSYLLLKFYAFSFVASGSGYVNLLININTERVWEIETSGEVLFKSLIDIIESK